MLACMLIPFGAVGGVLIVEALRSGQHAITVGPFGLQLRTRNRTTIIDWYEVEVIAAIMRNSRISGYRVTRKPQGTELSAQAIYWPATLVGATGPYAISGDELAALLSQRSGEPIPVR
jgi:hypothetical protein